VAKPKVDECCVPGCEEDGVHRRVFTIVTQDDGEYEVDSAFCCAHLDLLDNRGEPPFLDLTVIGVVRDG